MSERSKPLTDLSSIRGEMRVMKISVFFMIIFAALNYVSFFRLLGVSGIPQLLLVLYRGLDLIFIFAFLFFCGSRVKLKSIDYLLLFFSSYPFLIGLGQGNLSLTFANDTIIFFCFTAKIIIFRTLLSRISTVVDLDTIFGKLASRIVFWLALIALLLIATANLMLGRGASFYYQAPAELTFAAALMLARGKILAYLFFVALSLLAGKRMVIIGLLLMAPIALITHTNAWRAILRFSAVVVVSLPILIIISGTVFVADLAFINKLLLTYQQLFLSMEKSANFLDILMYLDPPRFAEYISLKPHLRGWSLWFGNGYGFRYELDGAFLGAFGYVEDYDDVTNAHFTPLGIASKFGLVGVLIWLVLLVSVLRSNLNRRSYVQYACWLGFLSMIAQSLFAFGFFISFFTPFFIATATSEASRVALSQRLPSIANKQLGYR